MLRIATVLVFAAGLAACDAVNTVTEGFKHASAVESDLEESTGLKPQVGFNCSNGRLVSVTVTFPASMKRNPCVNWPNESAPQSASSSNIRLTTLCWPSRWRSEVRSLGTRTGDCNR